VTLGRAPDQDLRLDHPTVSRRHALLRKAATGWEVVDLCSTNGTRVNGYRVVGAQRLRPGDIVSFGELTMAVSLTGYQGWCTPR
jgi:pSer/pThr/pTyr-binding forkhead associated (FHA) protein